MRLTKILRKISMAAVAAALLSATASAYASEAKPRSKTTRDADDAAYNINNVRHKAEKGDAAAQNQLAVWMYTGQNVPQDVAAAVDLWRKAAAQNNVKAISNLGVCYQYGTGVERDSITAMRLFISAIDGGQSNLFAQRSANIGKNAFDGMLLGLCYERGIGTDIDLARAAQAYAASADLGSADAMGAAARTYAALGNQQQAYAYAQRGASAGNIESKAIAGRMLVDGNAVAPDISKGTELLLQAAHAGNPQATNRLAQLSIDGKSDLGHLTTEIADLTAKQARNGDGEAMLLYAKMLTNGTGVQRDYDKALYWLGLASALGFADEATTIARAAKAPFDTYIIGVSQLSNRSYDAAIKTFKKLEKLKVPEGALMLATVKAIPNWQLYAPADAVKKLQKLADKDARAAYWLSELYSGKNPAMGVTRDTRKALDYLVRAANNGHYQAQQRLGDVYYQGELGVVPDKALAAKYYEMAFENRSLTDEGAKRLAEIYTNGAPGVAADTQKALRLNAYKFIKPSLNLPAVGQR